MPRIDRSTLDHSAYRAIRETGVTAANEHNDCTVVAVAAACQVTYDVAHAALLKEGRKPRRGAVRSVTHRAIRALGFELERIDVVERFIKHYPKAHQILRSVTTHHPDRFKSVWTDGETYLMHVRQHVLTIRNGVNMDWSRGRALRARMVYRIVPFVGPRKESK
jgi:hypothetical protein